MKSIKTLQSKDQAEQPSYKPRGLWVSVEGEDDWRSWCESESFQLEALAVTTVIVLDPAARILLVRSAAELDAFTKRYEQPLYAWQKYDKGINWAEVAREYQGIIIAPYVWSRRMELTWYYGWDCASGCIWDAAAMTIGATVEEAAVAALAL